MVPDAVITVAALAAAPIGLLWVEYHRRRDDRIAKQKNCYHRWGEAQKAPIDYIKRCIDCNLQAFCDKEGNELKRP